MNYHVTTLYERPDLIEQVAHLDHRSWPTFLQHSDAQSWSALYSTLSQSVIILLQNQQVIAVGFSVAIFWDQHIASLPTRIEDILLTGLKHRATQTSLPEPNTLVPIGVLVEPQLQGQGLSRIVLTEMKAFASQHGMNHLVVPVRPTHKARYPSLSMEEYCQRKNPSGFLFDPWLRVHQKLGANIIHIAPCTLTVVGTRREWANWTDMPFAQSGQYIVPGALTAVEVDADQDCVCYQEPNVWMRHPMP